MNVRDLSKDSSDEGKGGGDGGRPWDSLLETHQWLRPFIPATLILAVSITVALQTPENSLLQYVGLAGTLLTAVFSVGAFAKGLQDHGATLAGCLTSFVVVAVAIAIVVLGAIVFG